MVFVKTKRGGFYEPPYTEEEELELLRRMNGGVVAFSRPLSRPHRPRPRGRKD
jgi:hypothetical protein